MSLSVVCARHHLHIGVCYKHKFELHSHSHSTYTVVAVKTDARYTIALPQYFDGKAHSNYTNKKGKSIVCRNGDACTILCTAKATCSSEDTAIYGGIATDVKVICGAEVLTSQHQVDISSSGFYVNLYIGFLQGYGTN